MVDKKKSPFDERLTLAEVRARIGSLAEVKAREGKRGAAPRPASHGKPGGGKGKR